ncbi:RNA polymerase sigma factor [Pedobacter sp. PWIIR3]
MEESAFLQLISQNQGIIHKICRLYKDTLEDQQDLFQEIVFQLWRAIDNFRNEAKPSTFIYRAALNTAISSFTRDRTREMVAFTDQLPETPEVPQDVNLVARMDSLLKAIKKLEEADRAIMALLLEDLSYREIGDIIGATENNVAVKISRIKNKLRTLLNL